MELSQPFPHCPNVSQGDREMRIKTGKIIPLLIFALLVPLALVTSVGYTDVTVDQAYDIQSKRSRAGLHRRNSASNRCVASKNKQGQCDRDGHCGLPRCLQAVLSDFLDHDGSLTWFMK